MGTGMRSAYQDQKHRQWASKELPEETRRQRKGRSTERGVYPQPYRCGGGWKPANGSVSEAGSSPSSSHPDH